MPAMQDSFRYNLPIYPIINQKEKGICSLHMSFRYAYELFINLLPLFSIRFQMVAVVSKCLYYQHMNTKQITTYNNYERKGYHASITEKTHLAWMYPSRKTRHKLFSNVPEWTYSTSQYQERKLLCSISIIFYIVMIEGNTSVDTSAVRQMRRKLWLRTISTYQEYFL